MRLTALVTAVGLLWGGGVQGQEGASGADVVTGGQKPADVVAELARKALSRPGDTATWGALARTIPDMALVGGADLESTFEAARLADSLTAASLLEAQAPRRVPPVEKAVPAPPERLEARRDTLKRALSAGLNWAGDPRVALPALVSLLGALVLLHAGRRRRPARRTEAGGHGRVWAVRTMASGGVEVQEIARRTGMAQDAVRMALGMGASPATPAVAATAPSARRRSAPAQAQLRREISAGARRFRDGRITYGGRVS